MLICSQKGLALALAFSVLALGPSARSDEAANASTPKVDPRLRVIAYDPDQVIPLRASLGYQLTIAFEPDERIENVAIGNALGWQVVPSRRADLLFVKPMERAPPTNMTVVTNLRRYAFELSVRPGAQKPDDPSLIYTLRFSFPPPPPPPVMARLAEEKPPEPPRDVNHAYSYSGSVQNLPLRIFDDGHATYFRFADDADFPAIFAIESDRSESLVNFIPRAGYVVVERLAPGFILRRGKVETRIFNDGYATPKPGPDSPKPHQERGKP